MDKRKNGFAGLEPGKTDTRFDTMKIIHLMAVVGLASLASSRGDKIPETTVEAIVSTFGTTIPSPWEGDVLAGLVADFVEIRVNHGQGNMDFIVFGSHMGKWFGFKAELRPSVENKNVAIQFEEFPNGDLAKLEKARELISVLSKEIKSSQDGDRDFNTAPNASIRSFSNKEGVKELCVAKGYYLTNKEWHLDKLNELLLFLREGK